jgi:hypothetical protein
MAQKALDTFVAEIDGAPVVVQKGQVFADGDPVVKIDAGRGVLFRQLDMDTPDPKPKRGRGAKPADDAGDGDT